MYMVGTPLMKKHPTVERVATITHSASKEYARRAFAAPASKFEELTAETQVTRRFGRAKIFSVIRFHDGNSNNVEGTDTFCDRLRALIGICRAGPRARHFELPLLEQDHLLTAAITPTLSRRASRPPFRVASAATGPPAISSHHSD
jgi:hypothetical protein